MWYYNDHINVTIFFLQICYACKLKSPVGASSSSTTASRFCLPVAPCGQGTMATCPLLVQFQWMFLARIGWQKSAPPPAPPPATPPAPPPATPPGGDAGWTVGAGWKGKEEEEEEEEESGMSDTTTSTSDRDSSATTTKK